MRLPILLALTAAIALGQGGPLDNRLLLKTPTDTWAGYHGDSTGRHYSALSQINRDNVHALSLAWVSRVSTANQDAVFGGDGANPAPTPPGASAPPVRSTKLIVPLPGTRCSERPIPVTSTRAEPVRAFASCSVAG